MEDKPKIMYYLYILENRRHDRHYIGITENLGKRVDSHNSGSVRSTKAYRPWKLVYSENFLDKTSARKREIFLKKTAKERENLFEKIKMAPSSSLA